MYCTYQEYLLYTHVQVVDGSAKMTVDKEVRDIDCTKAANDSTIRQN